VHAGRAVAIDSTVLRARGGFWHKRERDAGVVPHTSIDTEAHWTKSGWHGWVYGWKLHLVATVAKVWIPLAAELTPTNCADSEISPPLLCRLPGKVRVVLGDQHYNTPELEELCAEDKRLLVTPRRGCYPHTDAGVEVRRIFHKLRSTAIENFNERADQYPPLRPGGHPSLSTRVVVPVRAWSGPTGRLETVPQSRVTNYDQASSN